MKQAIDAPRTNHFNIDPDELTIVTSPGEPFYDERVKLPLDEGFVANIAEYGVLEPILATKSGDRIVVIAGRQRVRAAREVNKGRKPADRVLVPTVMKRGEELRLELYGVVENEQRQADDAITRALKMQRLIERGASEAAVALAFGVTEQTVKNAGKLLDLAPKVQALVRDGKLPATAAVKLSGLAVAQQEAKAAEVIAAGGSAVEAVRRAKAPKAVDGEAEAPTPAPSRALLRRIADVIEGGHAKATDECYWLLAWALGRVTERKAKKHLPWLADALAEAAKDRRKKAEDDSQEEAAE